MKPEKALRVLALLAAGWLSAGCVSTRQPPEGWRHVDAGMTRAEITAAIGHPQSPGLGPRDFWRSGDWELQVTYDRYGRATRVLTTRTAR